MAGLLKVARIYFLEQRLHNYVELISPEPTQLTPSIEGDPAAIDGTTGDIRFVYWPV